MEEKTEVENITIFGVISSILLAQNIFLENKNGAEIICDSLPLQNQSLQILL